MTNNILLSIIIPVYNSEKTISLVVSKIIDNISDKYNYETILVNDNSSDNSYLECINLSKKYDFIKFINLSKNFGQHNAILAGLNYAKGGYIIILDDDLQTDPKNIIDLINKIEEGFDVVYANYKSKYHERFHNLGSKFNDLIMNILFHKPKNIQITSYFIIKRFLVDEIKKYSGPYPYLGGLILQTTDNIGKIDIEHYERHYGKSNYSFLKLFRLWVNGFTNFSVKPLRIAFLLGFIFSIIGFLIALFLIIRKIITPDIVLGWTSILVSILIFSGIQMISLGLIGEYVGRIFLSLNRQPQFVIKEKLNIEEDDK